MTKTIWTLGTFACSECCLRRGNHEPRTAVLRTSRQDTAGYVQNPTAKAYLEDTGQWAKPGEIMCRTKSCTRMANAKLNPVSIHVVYHSALP